MLVQPLTGVPAEEAAEGTPSPEATAGLFSTLTFKWISPLMSKVRPVAVAGRVPEHVEDVVALMNISGSITLLLASAEIQTHSCCRFSCPALCIMHIS